MTLLGFSPSFAALLAIWLFGAALAIALEQREIRSGPDDHVLDSVGSTGALAPKR